MNILSWLIGGGLSAITKQIADVKVARITAETSAAQLDADVTLAGLEAQRDLLIAESQNAATRWIRPAFALPFILYNFKLVVWDKILGLGVTDPLSTELIALQGVIFAAYFWQRPAEKRR